MKESFDLPMTHIERMDLEEMRHRQAKELAEIHARTAEVVAKERRKEERTEMWIWIGVSAAIAAVLITCVYAWWIDEEPKTPEDYKNTDAYREQVCLDNGGGWIPKDLLYDGNGGSDRGLCVYPGKRAEGGS